MPSVTSGRGRPRNLAKRDALDAATRCFWAHGYSRASIAVLCDAMLISRASLYSDFGDKGGLFLAAIDHYAQTYSAKPLSALKGSGDAQAELLAFFHAMIDLVTRDPETPGCLIACVLSEAATADPRYQELLARKTDDLEDRFLRTMRAAAPPEADATLHAKAGMLAATARGLAIGARAGLPADRLRATAQLTVGLACTSAAIH